MAAPLARAALAPVPQEAKALQLTIGYHQLEGKRVPLKKPVALLSKQNTSGSQRAAGEGGEDPQAGPSVREAPDDEMETSLEEGTGGEADAAYEVGRCGQQAPHPPMYISPHSPNPCAVPHSCGAVVCRLLAWCGTCTSSRPGQKR
jgi:hypothetical protein